MSKHIFLDTNLLLDVVEDILLAVCAQDGRCETILRWGREEQRDKSAREM